MFQHILFICTACAFAAGQREHRGQRGGDRLWQSVGVENTDQWDRDELLSDRLDELVKMAQANDSWGSTEGKLREHILANLHPKLDYRAVLRKFRTSILS